MRREFLDAAEQVLKSHNRPLLIKDIVQRALDEQLLKTEGKTPLNTMRARLSEHIRKYKENSTFVRATPNRFALREWGGEEYKAKPFEKNRNNEIVVCVRQTLVDKHKRFFGFSINYRAFLDELAVTENLIMLPRREAQNRTDIKQLVSYVLLKTSSGKILSFIRGNYGQKESLLKGVLCIGFGGHVNIIDIDLFGSKDGGLQNSALREINEEVKGLKIFKLRPIGIINDDSSPLGFNHIAMVYEAKLPKKFKTETFAKERSISKLMLLSGKEVWLRFHELEFWSQILVKELVPKPTGYDPVFIKTKLKRFNNSPLVVVGEIGSGKSEVAEYLSKRFQLQIISTRRCVAKLIGEQDFGIENRKPFQEKAVRLIANSIGIKQLAEEISNEVNKIGLNCIIDGIRNIETYNILKESFREINLLYIDVPRDTAFKLFSTRSKGRKVTIHEFREARHHEVEKEITLFKTRADAYLFNGGNLNDLYKAIKTWWNERNKI